MQRIQETFFEEYKYTDALCRDLLAAERGVSEYIEQMEAAAPDGRALVEGWQDDYYALKHLRWLRNQIAHEPGGADCTAAELEQLRRFHQRILARQDPLALLHQARGPRHRPHSAAQPARRAGGRAQTAYTAAQTFHAAPQPPRRGAAGKTGRRRQGAGLRVVLCAVVLALLFLGLCAYLLRF